MQNESGYPLTFAKVGTKLCVVNVKGKAEIVKHLSCLGLTKNASLEIVSKNSKGLIVKIRETKIALDDKLIKNIIIVEQNKLDEKERI